MRTQMVTEAEAITALKNLGGKVVQNEHIPGNPAVCLDLTWAKITDSNLELVKGLKSLKTLQLGGSELKPGGSSLTDSGLTRRLTILKRLYLNHMAVTGPGLLHLSGLTNPEKIDLRGIQLTDDIYAMMREALPHCDIS